MNIGKNLSIKPFLIMFLLLAVLGWGISKSNADTLADTFSFATSSDSEVASTTVPVIVSGVNKSFSAIGIVSEVSTTTLSINGSTDINGPEQTAYVFNTGAVVKIETKDYIPLTFSDISVGDSIVVQGTEKNGEITIRRIISLSVTSPREVATSTDAVATSTATSTNEIANATTTDDSATSSAPVNLASSTSSSTDATNNASSSESSDAPSASKSIIEIIKEKVSDFVDMLTGATSTPPTSNSGTSTESSAEPSTTESSTGSSTPAPAAQPEPAPTPQPAPASDPAPAPVTQATE